MINNNAPLLPEEIINRVKKLNVALILDGVKKAKISIPMDGVCVIPKEYIEVVLEKAEEKLAYEEKRVALIENYALQLEKGGELPKLAPKEVVEIRMRLEGKA
jgi:hypothetical protein